MLLWRGNIDGTRLLLKNRAKVESDGIYGTPLYQALIGLVPERLEIAELLYQAGADINEFVRERSLLSWCLMNGNIDSARWLLSKPKIVLPMEIDGIPIIHYAVRDAEVFRKVVELGADLKAVDYFGSTLLMRAMTLGNDEAVSFLVEKGADISATDKSGNSVLHYIATGQGNEISPGTIELLVLKNPKNLNLRNNNGDTPLMMAARHAKLESVNTLINLGADPKILNKQRESAFGMRSGIAFNIDALKLLEYGIDHQYYSDEVLDFILKNNAMDAFTAPCNGAFLSGYVLLLREFERRGRPILEFGPKPNKSSLENIQDIRRRAEAIRPRSFQCDEAAKIALEAELEIQLKMITAKAQVPGGC